MSKPPLLVHVLFHPDSPSARELARHIHRQLNEDLVVPGLRVPTAFCPYRGTSAPPEVQHLALAEHSFVAVLADERLNVDDAWCTFVADVAEHCEKTGHRFVPIQIDASAWPLDDRLQGVSFARAYLHDEGERKSAYIVRRIVIELCRYLAKKPLTNDESRAPVELFLSHTKMDLNAEPKVMQRLMAHLDQAQPVNTWIDSGDIDAGSRFAESIRRGIKETALLVVLTDNYATREWCRREVLMAKEQGRPAAVIDALSGYEVRSFPYLGNLPTVRWDGDPAKGVDLLLKEMLRQLHAGIVLQSEDANEVRFLRPPELATLVGVAEGKTVLYPDPPLGADESELLAKTGISFTTPLRRLAMSRKLNGKTIAMSMSDSTDIHQFGLDAVHLERAIVDISRYLLIQGARLAYGGSLAPGGFTDRLFELVLTHNESRGSGETFRRIVNHRGWPFPRLTLRKLSELKRVAEVVELERPADIDETLNADFKAKPEAFLATKSAAHRFAWARGMTEMRSFQANAARSSVCSRIVLGGTFAETVKPLEGGGTSAMWYSGRIPGVLEEVYLSAKAGQPVFLIGAFGGAARLIIDLLRGVDREEATWEYQQKAPFSTELRRMYADKGIPWDDYPEIVAFLRDNGIARINPLLTEPENEELFDSFDPTHIVELILTGLGNLH